MCFQVGVRCSENPPTVCSPTLLFINCIKAKDYVVYVLQLSLSSLKSFSTFEESQTSSEKKTRAHCFSVFSQPRKTENTKTGCINSHISSIKLISNFTILYLPIFSVFTHKLVGSIPLSFVSFHSSELAFCGGGLLLNDVAF